jgi:hypothetical protein
MFDDKLLHGTDIGIHYLEALRQVFQASQIGRTLWRMAQGFLNRILELGW